MLRNSIGSPVCVGSRNQFDEKLGLLSKDRAVGPLDRLKSGQYTFREGEYMFSTRDKGELLLFEEF